MFLLLLGFDGGGWYLIRSPVFNTSPSTPILNPLQKWLWQNLWTQAFYSPYHFPGGIQNCKCDYNTYMHAYTDSNTHIPTFICTQAHTCTPQVEEEWTGRGLVDHPQLLLGCSDNSAVCLCASEWGQESLCGPSRPLTQVLAAIGCNMHSSVVA